MSIWIIRDDLFLEHDAGPGHPERAERLRRLHASLDADPVAGTRTIAPDPVPREILERAHDPDYIRSIEATAGHRRHQLDPDTATSPRSYEAAIHAAGAVVQSVDAVARGDADGAFALVRPPGHHAETSEARGFCLFNNVAVAARHALDDLGCRRVLVLDPDVHHGNGTQDAFWEDSDVLYVSTHQYPLFPGTGWFDEVGAGPGEGFTVDLPCPPGFGDADMLHLYRTLVHPIVDEFEPDLILVSAGFDTWHADPIGSLRMTGRGYHDLFELFRAWSDRFCPGRLVFTLEGGYEPEGIIAGVRAALAVMTGEPGDATSSGTRGADGDVSEAARGVATNARRILAPYWRSLRSSSDSSR